MTVCPWIATAGHDTVAAEGARHEDAAWFSPKGNDAVENVEDGVAFWQGVEVR